MKVGEILLSVREGNASFEEKKELLQALPPWRVIQFDYEGTGKNYILVVMKEEPEYISGLSINGLDNMDRWMAIFRELSSIRNELVRSTAETMMKLVEELDKKWKLYKDAIQEIWSKNFRKFIKSKIVGVKEL